MKNFFYILVVLPLFLVSCSKEEEENAIDPTIFNKNISVGESNRESFRVINFLLQYRQRQIQTFRNSFPQYDIICRFGAIPRNVQEQCGESLRETNKNNFPTLRLRSFWP